MESLGDRMIRKLGYPYKLETNKTIKYFKFDSSSNTRRQGDFTIWKETKRVFKANGSKVFTFEEIKAVNQKILELESEHDEDFGDWLIEREDSIGE